MQIPKLRTQRATTETRRGDRAVGRVVGAYRGSNATKVEGLTGILDLKTNGSDGQHPYIDGTYST